MTEQIEPSEHARGLAWAVYNEMGSVAGPCEEDAIEAARLIDAALDEAAEVADKPAPCDMVHQEPFDFAECRTHDTTFPLGDKCEWDGVESITDHLHDVAEEQRERAVVAEFERDEARAEAESAHEARINLANRNIALKCALARVTALADEWDRFGLGIRADAIRAALDGSEQEAGE